MKEVEFSKLRIGDVFIHGISLYKKISKTQGSPAFQFEFYIVEKYRFKSSEKVELIKSVSFKGKLGSGAKLSFD